MFLECQASDPEASDPEVVNQFTDTKSPIRRTRPLATLLPPRSVGLGDDRIPILAKPQDIILWSTDESD
jgi:hypothetical protein